MTDAELYQSAKDIDEYYVNDPEVRHLAAYVARYTDPTPLAECLERVAGERGGWCDIPDSKQRFVFRGIEGVVTIYPDGKGYYWGNARVSITTAGELHRLLDAMGVGRG